MVVNSGPGVATEGDALTYSITVRNAGPSNATNVVLTDTLDANLKYVSSTRSQGTLKQSGNVLKFTLGSLAVGQVATITITARATEDGNLTNAASATSSVFDIDTSNNSTVATTAVAEPPIVVSGPITVNGKKVNNQVVATFTHANGAEPANEFIATINWGDGTISTGTISLSGTTYSVKGSHTYSNGNQHTVTTTVVESESGGGAAHGAGTDERDHAQHIYQQYCADGAKPNGSAGQHATRLKTCGHRRGFEHHPHQSQPPHAACHCERCGG